MEHVFIAIERNILFSSRKRPIQDHEHAQRHQTSELDDGKSKRDTPAREYCQVQSEYRPAHLLARHGQQAHWRSESKLKVGDRHKTPPPSSARHLQMDR